MNGNGNGNGNVLGTETPGVEIKPLQMTVSRHVGGGVAIEFGAKVRWFVLPKLQALQMIQQLADAAGFMVDVRPKR